MRPGHCNEAGAPGSCSDCEGRWGLQRGEAVVVAASSSPRRRVPPRRGSVATFRWRHFGGDISVATFRSRHFGGDISVATFRWHHSGEVVVTACSSPHRRRCASSSLRLVVVA